MISPHLRLAPPLLFGVCCERGTTLEWVTRQYFSGGPGDMCCRARLQAICVCWHPVVGQLCALQGWGLVFLGLCMSCDCSLVQLLRVLRAPLPAWLPPSLLYRPPSHQGKQACVHAHALAHAGSVTSMPLTHSLRCYWVVVKIIIKGLSLLTHTHTGDRAQLRSPWSGPRVC